MWYRLDEDWVVWLLLPGLAALALALAGWIVDRRRMRRTNPDGYGLLPWLALSFWASFAALLLLGAAFRGWLNAS